ncbi:hypothetical protein LZQ00_15840 [Sphingobacterium sp. SRCM116780]|uniref:hypothetical protein n=1 Tax=Sphingobacterium sp. SRCM116780 TaxID=2907623 RepID=UPI001F1F07DA|nr:hypothetical protein [Sphingobacterium sp. SRCM116780]UIR55727.1 hypothetical protein LZQ00_15840 [Sphingobacterium sp. SRCM116780]
MRLYFLLLILLFSGFTQASAQSTEEDKSPYRIDEKDYEWRTKMTIPPYGLEKVKKLIAAITLKEDPMGSSDGGIEALTTAQFKSLSLREKFTYVMIHAELSEQNCAIPEYQNDIQKKIFGALETGFNEALWSQRQVDFLVENRDSVMQLIQESVLRSKRMGVNYKEAILEINAWEMIPFMITYIEKTPLDKDALTLLMLLMKRGEYEEFLKSTAFQKLYGSESNYYSFLNYNKANEDLICARANRYYKERMK